MPSVFLHGGPGFNSFAERTMLGPLFETAGLKVSFWDEPSRLRPEGDRFEVDMAFDRWLASAIGFVRRSSASGPVHLITHSSTVHAGIHIAREHPERVASLVLVAPSADNFTTFKTVLRIARDDLAASAPHLAETIASSLARTRTVMDDAMREGMLAAVQDERLFTHYFVNQEQLRQSAAVWSRQESQFDLESFLAVLSDFRRRGASLLEGPPVRTPALALFGTADPITPMAEHLSTLQRAVTDLRVELIEGVSHCLHLDWPQHFVDRVLAWTAFLEAALG
jgi:pimeloyl-ACP methyl ester carboxylesterase